MIRRIGHALARVEGAMTVVAAALLFVIMMLVVADVFMRYVAGRPFSFTYDLVGLYLMTGVFYLVLSHAQAAHAHVAVDILLARFSMPARRLADMASCLAGGSVFALITAAGYQRALDNYLSDDVLAGAIPWPTWASAALVPIGAGLLVLRLAATFVGHVASLATGRDLVGVPPLSTAELAEGGTFE
jgi:TRAP-type C4-dicarboxylate transport system permease small subunit